MSKKKILYLEVNSDGTIGGSHHCLYEIVKHIDRTKYIPSVLFYQENALVTNFKSLCDVIIIEQASGLVVERDFPEFYKSFCKAAVLQRACKLLQKTYNFFVYYIPSLSRIYKMIKHNGYDLIHANNTPDLTDWLILSKITDTKMVSHLRFPWSPGRIRKFLIGRYDKIISISNYVTEQLRNKKIPCDNVVTVHDGIDIAMIEKHQNNGKDFLTEFGIPENTQIIGMIGNIRWWKGQHVALEAMKSVVKRHGNARCIFVGEISSSEDDRKYLEQLKDSVKEYGLEENIHFLGYRKDIPNILSHIDILVHASILPEPLGRVILEGMIYRKPIIATSHGGPLESIEDGISGLLIPPDDPKLLSEKISFLIENKDIAQTLGENARKRVEKKFGISENVRKIEEIYAGLLEAH